MRNFPVTTTTRSFPTCVLNVQSDRETIDGLQFSCDEYTPTSWWISPQGYRGTCTLFTRKQPLSVNYIADDKSSLMVRLDTDTALYEVLTTIEAKVKAASPDPSTTNDLISHPDEGSKYSPSFKLKCAYTQWHDADGKSITKDQALSTRGRLLSYVVQIYRLNKFRGRYYFAVVLKSAKVGPPVKTRSGGGGGGGGATDYSELL
jgi:hypothetical protein